MPFLTPDEPYAKAPKAGGSDTSHELTGDIDLDDGFARVRGVLVPETVSFDAARELELEGSVLEGSVFHPEAQIEATGCTFRNCDLSQVRVVRADRSEFIGCKFVGTDFSGTRIEHVRFERCLFRYTNIRMAKLAQSVFIGCSLDEVDFYDTELTDVAFPETSFADVVFDRTRFERVDLRGASTLGLSRMTRLDGALIADKQVIELAYLLALASGADIEAVE
jgi:uncharacterized protein YjbI with pentapeptide repeats